MAQKSTASISYVDYDGETSSISFLIPTLSDAVGSDDLADTSTELRELRDAINAVTLGTWVKNQINSIDFEVAVPPAEKQAQRETKWLVTYMDNESSFNSVPPVPNPGYGRFHTMELPCADLSLLPTGGSPDARRFLDITAGVGLTLKTKIENLVLSPSGGNVQVVSVEHVGRNI